MSSPIWTAPPGTTALIFDCDGTLADTMPIHFKAWTAMLGRHGFAFPETRFYELGGVPTKQIIRILSAEQGVPIGDLDAMVVEKEDLFLTMIDEIQPVRAVYDIGRDHRHVYPMAVASGGYRAVVERTLKFIGVEEWFHAIVCAEDTARHKPEPDVFLEAAKRMGQRPECCVVFEDTEIGLEAARRAGMHGVDVRAWYGNRD